MFHFLLSKNDSDTKNNAFFIFFQHSFLNIFLPLEGIPPLENETKFLFHIPNLKVANVSAITFAAFSAINPIEYFFCLFIINSNLYCQDNYFQIM